jgi:hypothetical protein
MSNSVIVLDGKSIIRMIAEGVNYLDDEGIEQFISYQACFENYLEEYASPKSWERHKELNLWHDKSFEDYVESVKSNKKVADRNIHDLYIEFYTEPRICFNFESQDEWWKLRKHIEKSGWRTWDMA